MRLFTKQKSSPEFVQTEPAFYPSGVCVKTEAGRFFINGKVRHRITSDRVFDSWNFLTVANATEAALKDYPVLKKLGFRNGALICNIADSAYYVIVGGERRQVIDPDVFTRLGLRRELAIWVSDDETKLHKLGEVLR